MPYPPLERTLPSHNRRSQNVITDPDISDLYRCLLGRAPESPGTVEAFRAYYPSFDLGRLAVLGSDEFSRVLNHQTGRVTAELTRRFLQRAGGVPPPDHAPPQPALAGAMRTMIRAHGAVRLAIVIGQSGGAGAPALADLLPLENAQAAILHVADDFPAFIPQTASLAAGGTLFRIGFDQAALAHFLVQAGLKIDLLALLGAPAGWWDALRPCLAERAILVAGADSAFPGWPSLEQPLHLSAGIAVRHAGGWFLPVTYQERTQPGTGAPDEAPIPGLTIAAIVRNEQAAIANMLASVMPIAGHVVVLDTGSTDETYAVAKACLEAAGKPCTIARAEPGRFDVMRNTALDLAPETAEWVLMLDADEELCPEDRAALRTLLAAAEHDAYALPRYNYPGLDKAGAVAPYPDRQVRLLRRHTDPPLRYQGAVHETVRDVAVIRLPLDAGALGHDRGGPHIHHLVRRFRSPEAEAEKQDYYRRIARDHAPAPATGQDRGPGPGPGPGPGWASRPGRVIRGRCLSHNSPGRGRIVFVGRAWV